jgi:DNA-binding NarL/FixJ family response regulator
MRVVIGDDQTLFRQGLARLLADEGFDVVAQAADAQELVRKVGAHRPQIVIADVRMPPTGTDDGLRAALDIRARFPDTAVLVLSHYVAEGPALDLIAGRPAGVGYLLKDRVAALDRFCEALHRVAEGGTALDPEVVSRLFAWRRDDPLGELTAREREVLALMAEGRSNHGIAEQLVVTEYAIEKHVGSVMRKLGIAADAADNRRVLAVLVYLTNRAH